MRITFAFTLTVLLPILAILAIHVAHASSLSRLGIKEPSFDPRLTTAVLQWMFQNFKKDRDSSYYTPGVGTIDCAKQASPQVCKIKLTKTTESSLKQFLIRMSTKLPTRGWDHEYTAQLLPILSHTRLVPSPSLHYQSLNKIANLDDLFGFTATWTRRTTGDIIFVTGKATKS